MQDFAKYQETNNLRFDEESQVWSIDLPSMLFGMIFSAILGLVGLKLVLGEEAVVTDEASSSPDIVEETGIKFDFYEELKRDDLHPPLFNNRNE